MEEIKEKANYCLNCPVKPCSNKGCPLNNDIPTFIKLTKEDKAIFLSVGEKMGYLDKEMQLNTIQLFLTQLEQREEALYKMLPEKCRISRLIGVLSGIFIVILLL